MESKSAYYSDILDINSYVARYEGYTKLRRLFAILNGCPSLRREAFLILHDELRKGSDIPLYFKLFESNVPELGLSVDMEWIEVVERASSAKYRSLDADLTAAKSTSAKESIRLGHVNLGQFYYARGNLQEALKCFTRTRDYCSQPRHFVEMCQQVISLYLNLDQYRNISSFVTRALNSMGFDGEVKSQMKSITALQALHEKNYSLAGKLFSAVGPELGGSFNYVIAQEDVTLYAVLCMLSSHTRNEVKVVLDSPSFKLQLELQPDLGQFVKHFFDSKFAACKNYLNRMQSQWSVDIYLGAHVSTLISMIEDQFIVTSFGPYDTVDLTKLSTILDVDYHTLECKLITLISTKQLPARIDSVTRVLRRQELDNKEVSMSSIINIADSQLNFMKRSILQLSIMKHKLCVTSDGNDGNDGNDVDEHQEMMVPNTTTTGPSMISSSSSSRIAGNINSLSGVDALSGQFTAMDECR